MTWDYPVMMTMMATDLVMAATLTIGGKSGGKSGDEGEEGGEGRGAADKLTPNRMKEAVLTRWWYVTLANQHILIHGGEWKSFAQKVINVHGKSSKKGKIAEQIVSLLDEPMIKCDSEFLNGFSLCFFHSHFKWLQGYDTEAKDCGYRSRSIAERYFFMSEDLSTKLRQGEWKQQEAFRKAVEAIGALPVPPENVENPFKPDPKTGLQEYFDPNQVKANYDRFCEIFNSNLEKHFERWRSGDIACFAYGGEAKCASALAKWVLYDQLPADDEEFRSEVHDRVINLKNYVLFMKAGRSRED